ncbi:inheritance of peroxisomes protein 1-domain-containing protein [Hypoxylon sp. NC1633]|nr:inheritance of peroxisomes protein 1-domain-containing protein [Hypoxylon sp. NC1633]
MAGDLSFTPDSTDMPQPRRSVTAPVDSPAPQPAPTSSRSEDIVETLYSHPSVKIISFNSTQHNSLGSRSFSADDDRPGTLPASSRLERTIAVGPFRIYRAPGSVAFLSCGSALQPILPKSQCWCIDEDNSRFVLQIRRPQYWRIELPVSDPDDKDRALVFRDVLDKALLFEKTECPFKRSFIVELEPQTPVKKKAWTSEGKNLISSPFSNLSSPSARAIGEDRRGSIFADENGLSGFDVRPGRDLYDSQRNYWQDKMHQEPKFEEPLAGLRGKDVSILYQNLPVAASNTSDVVPAVCRNPYVQHPLFSEEEAAILSMQDRVRLDPVIPNVTLAEVTGDETVEEPSSFEGSGHVAPMNLTRKRMSRVLAGRAFTSPPQLTVVTSPPSNSSKLRPDAKRQPHRPPSQRVASDASSSVGSTDSFHSVESWHSPTTPLPPSPPSSLPVTPFLTQFPHPHEDIVLTHPTSGAKDTFANTPDTERTFIPADHTDEIPSPIPRSPADSDGSHVSPVSVGGAMNESSATVLRERSQVQLRPRPRPRLNSLSMSRRALSPLPPAANLFSPPSRQAPQSRMAAVRRLPSAIIHKTIEILLSPPAYLVNLMLRVAARIVAGEWRGLVFGFGEGGEKIPVQWNYSDGEFSSWSDDEDYAMASYRQSSSGSSSNILPKAINRDRRSTTGIEDNRGWEVD